MTQKTTYRLPCGKYTTSQNRHIAEWKKVARPICKALDVALTGFDPYFSFKPNRPGAMSFTLPAGIAVALAAVLNARKEG